MVCVNLKDGVVAAICKHCGRSKVNRPRGLCWTCYYTDGVKDLYPSTSKYARRGEGNITGSGTMPEPTSALPGSVEKLEVLAMRARLKQALWHPRDATGDSAPARLPALLAAA